MRKLILALMLITSCFLTITNSYAQRGGRGRGRGGWGIDSQYSRMFNPNNIESIKGSVTSVDSLIPMRGMSYGLHLNLKTEKEIISVHLGPSWYFANNGIKIKPTKELIIKGSRITFEGKPAIIAMEIKKNGEGIKLRDNMGIPV